MKYLYNGVSLPALPEWDTEIYPYAVIGRLWQSSKWYGLYAFSEKPEIYIGEDGYNICGVPNGCDKIVYRFSISETWEIFEGDNYNNNLVVNPDSAPWAEPIWTNTDILNTDGTLYLAASDPIPVIVPAIDPLSMWLGWKAGNWVARQRGKKAEEEKTPVAYLYNGVRLPDINAVWTDKEKYPYATISPMTRKDGAYVLFLTDGTVYGGSDEDVDFTGVAYAVNYAVYIFAKEESGNTWLYQRSGTTSDSDGISINSKPIWCNNAVLSSDGTVFLAASEPVRVYE